MEKGRGHRRERGREGKERGRAGREGRDGGKMGHPQFLRRGCVAGMCCPCPCACAVNS